jgi:hypothetical protein
MVERDPTLCELHNGDVGILVGDRISGRNIMSLCLILIYFMFLFKLCSCLEFDLTLDLNH